MEKLNNQRFFKTKKEIITPYDCFTKGEYATSLYWGSKFGKTNSDFESDYDNGLLDNWFEEYFKD